jgi:alcohol dehydrogenase class IV
MTAVLRFNRSHAAERIGTLERALGLAPGVDLATHIERLNERLALPACLADMGVTAAMLPAMVEGAVRDHSNATNPRPASREDYEMLFQQVLHR